MSLGAAGRAPRLGIRANLAQFSLLVGVNALVGGMIGQERTVLPLLGQRVFHLEAYTAALTFILAFGAVKAVTNFFAGTLSDRVGRKPVLVAGWLVGLPVPLLLIWAPSWAWIVVANLLLGVNQGLTWSTTVIMKIDLAGPARRGLAMGLNEAAGYGAVAATALGTGFLAARYGLRPAPFFLGVAYAGLGLGLSSLFVRETHAHAKHEATTHVARSGELHRGLSTREVFLLTSFRERALSAVSQAGMVNNLNDGMAWGIFPLFFARGGLSIAAIGTLAAMYPAVWGLGQLVTGALSDRLGRKWLIVGGMWLQAVAIGVIAATHGFAPWALGAVLLGAGTAMVYPTLLAAIGDVAHPTWRASSVGVYRLWRDGGFAVGALLAGGVADALGLAAAIWVVAAVTAASGVVVAVRMYETHGRAGRRPLPPWHTVLAVGAHPDDESFGMGAVLAAFADAGARISVLSFTHGEASTLHGADGDLACIRARELRAAARILGVDRCELLAYPDGGLTEQPLDELVEHVCAAVDKDGADGLLVFDDGGITGHPDHRRATEAALAAADRIGLPVLAWAIPLSVASRLNEEFGTSFVGRADGDLDITLHVDRTRQRQAIAEHRTQSDGNPVLWRRLELLGDGESLRWLRRPRPARRPADGADDA